MNNFNFQTMTRTELRQYILNHREDQNALQIYVDRFQNPNSRVFPAPENLEDINNYPELYRQHLEEREQA
jgi:hypothetical protein